MATIKLTQDFKEFLQLLNSEKIEYLLIGGYAVALYGYIRPTKDMDVWIATDSANLALVKRALTKFGFAESTIPEPMFTSEQTILRMGVPPNQLELLSEIAGLTFRECVARAQSSEIDGVPVQVIDYDDLKRNKLATGRAGDRVDVERLEKRRRKSR
jgi:hypothetical protein